MQKHEFTQEQLNGPKNVLGYPELQRMPHMETTKQTRVIYESSAHKDSSTTKKIK